MSFIIVKNDLFVMLKPVPGQPAQWAPIDEESATNYARAMQFESSSGASACAQMQGANVHTVGDFDK